MDTQTAYLKRKVKLKRKKYGKIIKKVKPTITIPKWLKSLRESKGS